MFTTNLSPPFYLQLAVCVEKIKRIEGDHFDKWL